MQRLTFMLALAATAFAADAQSTTEFHAYDGPPVIREGAGGTKITKRGIDFWTAGTPYRRYQVIGTVTDARSANDTVSAVGSPGIAKKVKQAGGNAVIVMSRESVESGVAYGLNPSGLGVSGYTVPIASAYTSLVVVKYLPDAKVP